MGDFQLFDVSLTDQIYEQLKDQILRHQFKPGELLDINKLAEQFKVSRTPVRDAIGRLASEELVVVHSRRGVYVTGINAPDQAELYEIALMIEVYALQKGTPTITPAQIQAIRGASLKVKQLLEEYDGSLERYVDFNFANREFHLTIVALAQNERLKKIYESLNLTVQIGRICYPPGINRLREVIGEHEAIVSAIASGDIEAAIRHMTSHEHSVRDEILAALDGSKPLE